MDKNYDTIVQERVKLVFNDLSQQLSTEKVALIKEAFELACETFASHVMANGKPYCLELLNQIAIYSERDPGNVDLVLASIFFPMVKYTDYSTKEISKRFGYEVNRLIFEVFEMERDFEDPFGRWEELPALCYDVAVPYTKEELMNSLYPPYDDASQFSFSPKTGNTEENAKKTAVLSKVNSSDTDKEETDEEFKERLNRRRNVPHHEDYEMYESLMSKISSQTNRYSLGSIDLENMQVLSILVSGYWKPRYLLDHHRKVAYEILDGEMCWKYFTTDDIDWKSMEGLDKDAIGMAKRLSAWFPSFVYNYDGRVALVSWELVPDGAYYMDEDGYGMSPDDNVTIYGVVDKDLNVLTKFRYSENASKQFAKMKEEARRKLPLLSEIEPKDA